MYKRMSSLPLLALVGLGVTAVVGSPASAQQEEDHPAGEGRSPEIEVEVLDLTPRFLTFYDSAVAEGADEPRRWALWKELYDFAALPPVPERDSLAREMLADAWQRYPAVIDRIRSGTDALDPSPDSLLRTVVRRLDADEGIGVDLLVFVGDTRSGGFFAADEGRPQVAVPIEESPDQRTSTMVHEFTHAVHQQLAGHSGGWERSVARTLFDEGLATRMEQVVMPGRPVAEYVEHRPGWFAEAESSRDEVLSGLLPHLGDDSSEQVARFTIGSGTTGLDREAYYAGWVVVGHLLDQGRTLADLARIPEAEIPSVVEGAVTDLLGAGSPDPTAHQSALAGRWEGLARTPGDPLGLILDLEHEDGAWVGDFAIPAEGVEIQVSGIRAPDDSVIVPLAPGRELRGVVGGDSIAGELEIQGRVMPMTLGRVGTATAERLTGEVSAAAEAARLGPLVATAGVHAGEAPDDAPGAATREVDAEALEALIAAADSAHTHALVVFRDSVLVGAWHAGGERRLIEAMSVTKAVVNLAVGRLVTMGAIGSIDEPVHEYYPEWNDEERSAITIRHLLNHTSGIASPMPTAPIYESDDFVQFALDAEQEAVPGTELTYNNNATNLLVGLAGRAAGERLDRFLAEDLFARLGITEFRWSLDPAGNPHGMAGLQVYAEDLAALGQLVLQRGLWEGERLIDDSWFDQSLRPGSGLDDDVGLLWWLIREDGEVIGYRADGYLGQYLVIYPEEGLVAVRMVAGSPAYDPESDGFRSFETLVRDLVPGR